ncbi:ABC transporter permease [Rhizohabitans arisaemae]|uniref:ABC transporter permease n=1 Tax=Rhizohabitans arisaemae TaxID=2720610 RepID=UPI0024B064EE|nr:ABC transporter permease [Rhizohabitans arisaemae]
MSDVLNLAWVVSAITLATPLILAMLGGLISERSGVINIGLEGQMLVGAFTGVLVSYLTGSAVLGLAAAVGAGVLCGLVFAALTIGIHADQIVAATAVNLVGAGLTAALVPIVWGVDGISPEVARIPAVSVPGLSSLPILGDVFTKLTVLDYAAFGLAVAVWWLLFRTHLGLQLRACGESPEAADTAGVPVRRLRVVAQLCAGGLAALGGASLSLATIGLFVASMSQGRGFLALAALLFGKWRVWPAVAVCLLFSLVDALQLRLQIIESAIPHELLIALPYLLAVLALATFVGRAAAPAAIGRPFTRR